MLETLCEVQNGASVASVRGDDDAGGRVVQHPQQWQQLPPHPQRPGKRSDADSPPPGDVLVEFGKPLQAPPQRIAAAKRTCPT